MSLLCHVRVSRCLVSFSLVLAALACCQVAVAGGDETWNRLVAPHRRSIDVGGYRMHYIDMGKGEPVMMVHGFADSTYCWHKNLKALLESGFRVILVDQPGLGRSEIPPKTHVYSVENQANAILEVMNRLNLKQVHLVGSSMGGGVALYLTVHHPQRVGRAVLFSPACFPRSRMGLHSVLRMPGMDRLGSALVGRWLIKAALKTVYFDRSKVTDTLVDEYSQPLSKPGYVRVVASLGRDFFSDAFRRMSENYERVTTPVLIVWGEQDKWLSPRDGRRLAQLIRTSKLVTIPNCGHLPQQERYEVANQYMVDFLRKGT